MIARTDLSYLLIQSVVIYVFPSVIISPIYNLFERVLKALNEREVVKCTVYLNIVIVS